MSISFTFRRPELAQELCNRLQGKGLSDARSGLFLAAPRRVGKSTFLREDLVPEISARGWLPVYVDLWANKERDPALIITEAIKKHLADTLGIISKAAKAVGLSKVNVMGTLTIDVNQPGLPDNVTLSDVIAELSHQVKKPIVLIVDEAQHALSTPAGLNAMFALKSARDTLNLSAELPALMLVFTGSNRDKLAHLVLNRTQPFFGSSITAFPLLSKSYTDAFTKWANGNLARGNKLRAESVWAAFQLLGHRPEMLRDLIAHIALEGQAQSLSEILEDGARKINNRLWEEFASEFDALTAIQKAVLSVLISKGEQWIPFSDESMAAYMAITKTRRLSKATVQTAIDGLREKNLVWKQSRGIYALEDQGFAEWFRHNRLAGVGQV